MKKCSRVEFREPLASYRLVLGQLTIEEKHAKIRFKLTVVFLTPPQKLVCFLPSPTHVTARVGTKKLQIYFLFREYEFKINRFEMGAGHQVVCLWH